MSNSLHKPEPVPVDDLWIADWAHEGLAALERYLEKHAAFAAYLNGRSAAETADGGGPDR